MTETHRIGSLKLNVAMRDFDGALAARARIEELARGRMPEALERQFDRLVPPGVHLRLDRLDLDLGAVSMADLENDVLAALERVLAEILPGALAAAGNVPGAPDRAMTRQEALLERFDTYLAKGTVPLPATGEPFDPAAQLRELIAQRPAELILLLRRRARDRHALERLVLQVGTEGLRALLAVLAPADAAVIVGYLADLMRFHRIEPVLPLTDAALERRLWLLTLEYLLRDAGTQFNRRSFLMWLLEGAAEAEGISYEALLRLLHAALARTRRHRPLGGSLPAILDELFAELPPVDMAVPEPAPSDDPFERAEAGEIEPLLVLFRRHAADRPRMEVLVRRLTAPLFGRLIERIEPAHAALILAYLSDLTRLHEEEAQLALSRTGFERLVHLLTLLHLLRDAGTQFNRRSWLRQLLEDLAASEGLAYPTLLTALSGGLIRLRRHLPADPALAGLLDELVREQSATAPAGEAAALARMAAEADDAGRAALIGRIAAQPGLLMRMVATLSDDARSRLLTALAPAQAEAVLSDLKALWRAHAGEPLLQLDSPGFARLTWTLLLQALVAGKGRRPARATLLRDVLAGLARHGGMAREDIVSAVRDRLDARDAALAATLDKMRSETGAMQPDTLRAIENFLRTGEPAGAGSELPPVAEQDPARLARLLRRLVVARPGDVSMLAGRLLEWLLPEEIVEILLPGRAAHAARWAEFLADEGGGTPMAAWSRIVTGLLHGEPIVIPDTSPGPGRRLDRRAVLRHWLDHGVTVWWAPAEPAIDAMLAELADWAPAALQPLFADDEAGRVRLRRAIDRLDKRRGAALLKRLGLKSPDASSPPPLASPALAEAPSAAPDDKARLLAWLSGEGPDAPRRLDRLIRLLADLADSGDPALDAALGDNLARPEVRARWTAALPDEILARLLYRLEPDRARLLLDTMVVLSAAGDGAPGLLWASLLALLAEPGRLSTRMLVGRLVAGMAGNDPSARNRLLGGATRLARGGGQADVVALLRGRPLEPAQPARKSPRPAREPPAEPKVGETIYIGNAGLVLFNPFLPRFFDMLGLLTAGEDGRPRIVGLEAASRAVHLLQYLVDERCDRPEPELVLNKLLCGVLPAAPVAPSIAPAAADIAVCDEVIRAVIGNWPIISNTSPAGLRETFLQREGRLRKGEGRWTLTVQRKTVDVLTDQIGWNRSVVFHRWMTEPVHVTW